MSTSYSTDTSSVSSGLVVTDKIIINDTTSNFTGSLSVPDTLSTTKLWTLPSSTGTSGQYLSTNGSGQLQFTTISAGGVTSSSNIGTGQNVFFQDNGGTLEYKGLQSGNANTTTILNGSTIEVDANESNFQMNVLTTAGDVLYRNASTYARLPIGTSGQLLTTGGTGANPSWQTSPSAYPSLIEEIFTAQLASSTITGQANLDFTGTSTTNKSGGSDWVINTPASGSHYLQWTGATSMNTLLVVIDLYIAGVSSTSVSGTNEQLQVQIANSSSFATTALLTDDIIIYRIPSTTESIPITIRGGIESAAGFNFIRIFKSNNGSGTKTFNGGHIVVSLFKRGLI